MKSKSLSLLNDYSHDLKSPLARIKALVELVKNSNNSDNIRDKLDRIDSSVDSVNFNIETVFTYLNLTNYMVVRETFDLSEIFNKLAKKYKIDIGITGDNKIWGDPILTQKMLYLLFDLIFVKKGENVQVQTFPGNSKYEITISFDKYQKDQNPFKDELPWVLIKDIASRMGIKLKTESGKGRQIIRIDFEK